MKNLVTLLIILNAITIYAQSPDQQLSKINSTGVYCEYMITYQPDSTNHNDTMSENFFLLANNNLSRFESINHYKNDSMIKNTTIIPGEDIELNRFPKTKFNYVIFKVKNEIIVYDQIYTSCYSYTENKNLNWIIAPESRKVNGWLCEKAFTTFAGRQYEAWFTRQIPISDGPYKFSGLPGLIVQISDVKNHYKFNLLSLQQRTIDPTLLFSQNKCIPTNKSEFKKSQTNYEQNAIDILAQHGSIYGDINIQRKIYKDKLKRRNNPIELK